MELFIGIHYGEREDEVDAIFYNIIFFVKVWFFTLHENIFIIIEVVTKCLENLVYMESGDESFIELGIEFKVEIDEYRAV